MFKSVGVTLLTSRDVYFNLISHEYYNYKLLTIHNLIKINFNRLLANSNFRIK